MAIILTTITTILGTTGIQVAGINGLGTLGSI